MDFEDLLDCGKLVAMMLFLMALLGSLNCGGGVEIDGEQIDGGTSAMPVGENAIADAGCFVPVGCVRGLRYCHTDGCCLCD